MKISQLPIAANLKARLAATVFATKASWGLFFNGRKALSKTCGVHFQHYNRACKSDKFPGGRASNDLRSVFFLGHSCDLNLVGALRAIRSSWRWHTYRARCGVNVCWAQKMQNELSSVLRDLGWTASAHGLVGPSENLSCQIGSNINYLDSVLHRIRVAWREKSVTHGSIQSAVIRLSRDLLGSRVSKKNRLRKSVNLSRNTMPIFLPLSREVCTLLLLTLKE